MTDDERRNLDIIQRRMGDLYDAIVARDWVLTETMYDRVHSQIQRLAGVRDREVDRLRAMIDKHRDDVTTGTCDLHNLHGHFLQDEGVFVHDFDDSRCDGLTVRPDGVDA